MLTIDTVQSYQRARAACNGKLLHVADAIMHRWRQWLWGFKGKDGLEDFYAVKPEQRTLYQEGVCRPGWIGPMPEPQADFSAMQSMAERVKAQYKGWPGK